MFQLIIAVTSIALVAGLALVTLWYGGRTVDNSGERAIFLGFMNEGGQIEGGLKLYKQDNATIPIARTTSTCPSNTNQSRNILCQLENSDYMNTVPSGEWEIEPSGENIYKPLKDMAQCKRLNEYMKMDMKSLADFENTTVNSASFTGCPPCRTNPAASNYNDSLKFSTWPGCKK